MPKTIKYLIFLLSLILYPLSLIFSQESHSIYQNHSFRHADRIVYQSGSKFHTVIKPYLNHQIDEIQNRDSLYHFQTRTKMADIIFNRNLIQYKNTDFQFTIDPLFHFEMGKDPDNDDISWINTRGFLINASILDKISLSTSFFENQASFNDFRHDRIEQIGDRIVPGQGRGKEFGDSTISSYDYGYVEGYISYSPNRFFNFQLGHGKNFWGDGYRSLLLSDNSFNYPYFKITTDIWKIKYVNLWAQFQDVRQRDGYDDAFAKKWGSLHFLDWRVTDWFSIGFFEAIVWQHADSTGFRGFDFNYANPVIFLRPVEFSVGSPDNALIGINYKFTFLKNHIFYGQAIIDEFQLKEFRQNNGWWGNKWGLQAGYKTYDLFDIQHLDIQTEFNYIRPYTYSHLTSLQNYAHYNQPIAHPLGSNFWESVSFIKYNFKRFFIEGRFSHAIHGSDTAGLNFGNDLYLNYNSRVREYNNELGQAEEIMLQYLSFKIAFLVNPSTNLNVYISYTNRMEKSKHIDKNQSLVTFGIRTSLQNFYYDF